MKRALVDPEKCENCKPCQVEIQCPMTAAFREQANDKPWVDFYRCCGCIKCKVFCKKDAIKEIYHPCDGKGRVGW